MTTNVAKDAQTPDPAPPHTGQDSMLAEQARDLFGREPSVAAILSLDTKSFDTDAELFARVLAAVAPAKSGEDAIFNLAREVFAGDSTAFASARADIAATTTKNFEPGGEIATLLFARGIHALLAHRVAHNLWHTGRHDLALAMKAVFGRAFSTDIHPAARMGRGIWLDHGLGFVVGETAIIEDDVSIWHGVTLGSTLKDAGPQRHPRLRRGATICADAIILGNVEIGEGSVVAAGAVVLTDVAAFTTVAGVPARVKQRSGQSFSGM